MESNSVTTKVSNAEAADAPPDCVWMHNSLGYWFSVADDCVEEGDIPYVPESTHADELGRLRSQSAFERDMKQKYYDEAAKGWHEVQRLRDALRELIGEELSGESNPYVKDSDTVHNFHVDFGMLRRARKLLNPEGSKG